VKAGETTKKQPAFTVIRTLSDDYLFGEGVKVKNTKNLCILKE